MTRIKITPTDLKGGRNIWVKFDETGPTDLVVAAQISASKPADEEKSFWKKLNILELSGIWRDGAPSRILVINDDGRLQTWE